MEIRVIHLKAGEEIEIVTDSENYLDTDQLDDFTVKVYAEAFPQIEFEVDEDEEIFPEDGDE